MEYCFLPPLTEAVPLFETPESLEEFNEWFYEGTHAELEKLRIARLKSEHESRFRILD